MVSRVQTFQPVVTVAPGVGLQGGRAEPVGDGRLGDEAVVACRRRVFPLVGVAQDLAEDRLRRIGRVWQGEYKQPRFWILSIILAEITV